MPSQWFPQWALALVNSLAFSFLHQIPGSWSGGQRQRRKHTGPRAHKHHQPVQSTRGCLKTNRGPYPRGEGTPPIHTPLNPTPYLNIILTPAAKLWLLSRWYIKDKWKHISTRRERTCRLHSVIWMQLHLDLILSGSLNLSQSQTGAVKEKGKKKETAGWKRCNCSLSKGSCWRWPPPHAPFCLHAGGRAFLCSQLHRYAKWYLTFAGFSAAWLTCHFDADWNISTKGWISVKLGAAVKIPTGSSSMISVPTTSVHPTHIDWSFCTCETNNSSCVQC